MFGVQEIVGNPSPGISVRYEPISGFADRMQGRPKKTGVLIRLSKNTRGLMPRIVVPEGQKTHAMEASPEIIWEVNGLRLERLGTTPHNEFLV